MKHILTDLSLAIMTLQPEIGTSRTRRTRQNEARISKIRPTTPQSTPQNRSSSQSSVATSRHEPLTSSQCTKRFKIRSEWHGRTLRYDGAAR